MIGNKESRDFEKQFLEKFSEFQKCDTDAKWRMMIGALIDLNTINTKYLKCDEALKIAVEALEFYADGESWSTIDHSKIPTTYDRLEYDKDLGDGDFQITEDTDDSNVSGLRARKSLAEIRKLRGEE